MCNRIGCRGCLFRCHCVDHHAKKHGDQCNEIERDSLCTFGAFTSAWLRPFAKYVRWKRREIPSKELRTRLLGVFQHTSDLDQFQREHHVLWKKHGNTFSDSTLRVTTASSSWIFSVYSFSWSIVRMLPPRRTVKRCRNAVFTPMHSITAGGAESCRNAAICKWCPWSRKPFLWHSCCECDQAVHPPGCSISIVILHNLGSQWESYHI